jgi:hypothetical protein
MPGRKAEASQYTESHLGAAVRGGRCTVGDGKPAPHRVTIRLSEAQWLALNEAAELLRLPVASAARRLLLSGVGLCSLEADPKAATAELAERAEWGKAQRKPGRPVIASAHS